MKAKIFFLILLLMTAKITFFTGCDLDDCDPDYEDCEDTWDLYDDEDDDDDYDWYDDDDEYDDDDDDYDWYDDDDDGDWDWDDDDDDDCDPVPATCHTSADVAASLKVKLSPDAENGILHVYLYEGKTIEDGYLISEDDVSDNNITYTNLNAQIEYSAKVEYTYGSDTILAIDGIEFDIEKEDYCDEYGEPVTCYSVEDGEIDLSFDKTAFKMFKKDENDHCFIATAAYGSLWDDEVVALRKFRDRWLMKTVEGRGLVTAYYKYSPPVARYIKGSEKRKAVVRALLSPIVKLVREQ